MIDWTDLTNETVFMAHFFHKFKCKSVQAQEGLLMILSVIKKPETKMPVITLKKEQ